MRCVYSSKSTTPDDARPSSTTIALNFKHRDVDGEQHLHESDPGPFAKPVNELVGDDGVVIGAACGHRIARDEYLGRRRLVDVSPPVDAVMEDQPM